MILLKKINFLLLLFFILLGCNTNQSNQKNSLEVPFKSPFSGIDTISTNDWWNRMPNPIIDVNVKRENVLAFGIYTISNNTLKLTAQLFPLYPYAVSYTQLTLPTNREV